MCAFKAFKCNSFFSVVFNSEIYDANGYFLSTLKSHKCLLINVFKYELLIFFHNKTNSMKKMKKALKNFCAFNCNLITNFEALSAAIISLLIHFNALFYVIIKLSF